MGGLLRRPGPRPRLCAAHENRHVLALAQNLLDEGLGALEGPSGGNDLLPNQLQQVTMVERRKGSQQTMVRITA